MDFQNINPELFVIIGELLGAVWANQLPFNVQNAIGNWLQLVGQAILTYNAQQQYYEQGPGRVFDPANLNVDNPDCQNNNENNTKTTSQVNQTKQSDANSSVAESSQENTIRNSSNEIESLQNRIDILLKRMDMLENELSELKK